MSTRSRPPDHFPITGMCIVAEPNACPPGYELIMQSHDKKDDCDLWKDSFFRSRVTRYLCYTRIFPLDGGRLNNVLADMAVITLGEPPPAGFSLLENTIDTGEKATRKKQLWVKMLARDSTEDAISHVIILSRAKRPPAGYTMVGEMNGLVLCYKMTPVPADTAAPITPATAAPVLNNSPAAASRPERAPVTRQDSVLQPANPMYGVPFELNRRLRDVRDLQQVSGVPTIQFRSYNDLHSQYNYPFQLERQQRAAAQ